MVIACYRCLCTTDFIDGVYPFITFLNPEKGERELELCQECANELDLMIDDFLIKGTKND